MYIGSFYLFLLRSLEWFILKERVFVVTVRERSVVTVPHLDDEVVSGV